ncbi:MAG: hypothetical protein JJE21_09090 [Spirochaetaceae bacterium]|nr:hypothetical protein [Spirochaetaceae bacterium]
MESRHLGLIGSSEIEDFNEKIDYLSSLAEKYIKIDELIELANSAVAIEFKNKLNSIVEKPVHKGLIIAIARDDAFCFTYQENLELMEEKGFELVYFSPLHDSSLPINISGLYFPGGYPELHLEDISANKNLLMEIKEKIEDGLPTIAECGGFLFLHRNVDKKDLVSLFDESAIKGNHLQNFGYSSLESKKDNLLFKKGEITFVHEFHYYISTNEGNSCIGTKLRDGIQRECVIATDTLFAGFPHLYFPSNPKMVERFINHMEKYKKGDNR